ncbi:MAG: hypothetical protein ACOCSE_00380 [Chitinivibrionales bacterium]
MAELSITTHEALALAQDNIRLPGILQDVHPCSSGVCFRIKKSVFFLNCRIVFHRFTKGRIIMKLEAGTALNSLLRIFRDQVKRSAKSGISLDPPWLIIDLNTVLGEKLKGLSIKQVSWEGDDIRLRF